MKKFLLPGSLIALSLLLILLTFLIFSSPKYKEHVLIKEHPEYREGKLNATGRPKGLGKITMIKTVSIYLSDDAATPTSRKKVGECAFFEDYSFKITAKEDWIKVRLSQAIKTARQKESILLRTEEMKNGALVMSGEMLKPGEKNYIHALINEAANELNRNERKVFFSLEY